MVNVPAGHGLHDVGDVAPNTVLVVPSGQGSHLAAPDAGPYVPGPQSMHAPEPTPPDTLRNEPGGHSLHDVAPSTSP